MGQSERHTISFNSDDGNRDKIFKMDMGQNNGIFNSSVSVANSGSDFPPKYKQSDINRSVLSSLNFNDYRDNIQILKKKMAVKISWIIFAKILGGLITAYWLVQNFDLMKGIGTAIFALIYGYLVLEGKRLDNIKKNGTCTEYTQREHQL